MSIIDRSEVEHLPVTEEALDLEAMDAVATEQKQDAEISTCGRTTRTKCGPTLIGSST